VLALAEQIPSDIAASRPRRRQADRRAPRPKKLAARLVRFDGAYLRLTGELRIEHRHADAVVDSYTDPAIWELMYLGKTGTRQ
jgi:hypothetical protein